MTAAAPQPTGHGDVVHFLPRRRRAPREFTALTLNLAPMIDVVFLLLIFFISTTTFKRAEGLLPAQLPRQSGLGTAVELPLAPIVVHLTQSGLGPADYEVRIEGFVDRPTTFNELTAFLTELQQHPGFDNETPVVIESGWKVQWDHVVGCWNAAIRAGCKRVSFGLE